MYTYITVAYASLPVQVIPNNADAGANSVKVTRSGPDAAGGYVWTVTFRGLHGNVDQMLPLPSLAGSGATVTVTTLVEGNQLAGTRCVAARSALSSSLFRVGGTRYSAVLERHDFCAVA